MSVTSPQFFFFYRNAGRSLSVVRFDGFGGRNVKQRAGEVGWMKNGKSHGQSGSNLMHIELGWSKLRQMSQFRLGICEPKSCQKFLVVTIACWEGGQRQFTSKVFMEPCA